MPADTPPPDRDRRDLRVVEPPVGEAAEPHAVFEGRKRGAPLVKTAVAVILIGGSAAVIGYAYMHSGGSPERFETAATPVVRPADGPIKVRPENPGGAVVPYQDTLLLNREDGEEVLDSGPTPREPAIDWDAVAARETASDPAAADPAPPPAPKPAAQRAAPDTPEAATTPNGERRGDYAVQVAALREERAARATWQRVQNAHVEVLGDLRLLLQQAELEDRGRFWRVRGGPFASRDAAEAACARLKAEGQGCFVVERR